MSRPTALLLCLHGAHAVAWPASALPARLAPYSADVAAGVGAVRAACAAAARLQGELCGGAAASADASIAKDDASPVTIADFAAQARRPARVPASRRAFPRGLGKTRRGAS